MNKEALFKECLEDMKTILNTNKQKFFLACGTLLGCYRDKKFISYDGDIDLGILEEDFKFDIIQTIVNTNKFKLHKKYGEKNKRNLEFTFKHINGTKIDIFIYYKIKDNFYYSSSFNDICSRKKEGFCKWGRHIDGFKEIEFYEKKYLIPSNVEQHLIDSYGEDFMIPKKFNYSQGLRGLYKNLLN